MHKVGILAAALLLIPAVSQAKTLDELMVERGVVAKSNGGGGDMSAGRVYYDGGTRIEFPDNGFTFGVNTLLMTRYEYTDTDGADETSEFSVTKARVRVSGSALNREFEYRVEGDFTESSSITDAYLKWNACDWIWAKMGRFKTGVARQYVNSEHTLQFADRSFTTDRYNFGRNEGLSIGGGMEGFNYGVSIFNDTVDAADTGHLYVLNARYTMGEMDVYTEGDVDGSADHGFTVGFAYGLSEDGGNAEIDSAGKDLTVYNVDAMWKYSGFSVAGEWFRAKVDDSDSEKGWYVQAGYFVLPSELEIAGRYSMITDFAGSDDDHTGFDVGVNYYWWAHQLKAQLNYSQKTEEVGGTDFDSDRFILQLVSWF